MAAISLPWLVELPALSQRLAQASQHAPAFNELAALANSRLNFLRTEQLDRILTNNFPQPPATGLAAAPLRLAVLGSSTTKHLHASIRVAALRRHLYVEIYEPDYGQYWTELQNSASALHKFQPKVVLFAFDARHLTLSFSPGQDAAAASRTLHETIGHLQACWNLARNAFDATILQQTVLPIFPDLLGQNEHFLAGAPASAVRSLNTALRAASSSSGVLLVAADTAAASGGIDKWYSETFWHQAKQEIFAAAAPLYGDLVMRVIAARFGRSYKCLVLDLDNTIWGGSVGDDGVQGLVLGQGSAEGEAFVAFQRYVRDLSWRGVILAVCSKNDEANALAPFEQHPDMVLKRSDIACFIANWEDKAANLRRIAGTLNIGLDSLVFVDDNPFERNLIRRELPMVAVPEIPEEPALIARCLADAGYFEAIGLTSEDQSRVAQYQANAERSRFAAGATDIGSYLKSLDMRLIWDRVNEIALLRTVQLINKTNQFNLTTQRYNEAELRALMADPAVTLLQFRLLDRFGDNGIIAIVIIRKQQRQAIIDTWLMSCRVLGRQVEEAVLALIIQEIRHQSVDFIVGIYRPAAKNAMVATHYSKLGFVQTSPDDVTSACEYMLTITEYCTPELFMTIEKAAGPVATN